jgi:E3 ubiquitin-protein ligase BOI-like protein
VDTFRRMENLIRSLEEEKRELKRIADEREAMTINLYNKLEEEKKRQRAFVANDVESCCGENEEAIAESCCGPRRGNIMMLCPNCNTNSSSVLFLPCWHLSSCKACETLLQACPICEIAKNGVVEIQSLILD